MKRIVAGMLVMVFMGYGMPVFADDSVVDCDCKKGGLGLKIDNFVIGFGVKNYKTLLGCNRNIGVGFVLGGETSGFIVGFGYDSGVVGVGFALRGPEETTSVGFGIGYDYGDCRMVWPYEE